MTHYIIAINIRPKSVLRDGIFQSWQKHFPVEKKIAENISVLIRAQRRPHITKNINLQFVERLALNELIGRIDRMEHEPIKYPHDNDFEDGEVGSVVWVLGHKGNLILYVDRLQLSDSNDSYTPLQRPNTSMREMASSLPTSLSVTKMDEASEVESLAESESSGSESDFTNDRKRLTSVKKAVK